VIGGKDCEKVTKTPKHGETFNIGSIAVKALHTPCHTQDSICFFMQDGDDKVVFTGDTLFHGGKLLVRGLRTTPFLTVSRLRQVLRGHRRGDAQGAERDAGGSP
jgi:glyoxylase-like metal-dependent hydrolase (beta-lactamase superfamily II)